MQAVIDALYIYPVKSLKGIALDSATVTHNGLHGDRQWMVVDEGGRMLTQRKLPAMAGIEPKIMTKENQPDYLHLHSAKAGGIDCPLPTKEQDSEIVHIWRDNCKARVAAAEVNLWLCEALQSRSPLRLVHFDSDHPRMLAAAERFGEQAKHFADAAPFLITNTGSLSALNLALQQQQLPPVDMRSFRPNIVIRSLPPFSEHNYSQIHISDGGISFRLVDHCQRCAVICVNQETGERRADIGPIKQLGVINPMPNSRAPAFGVNCLWLNHQQTNCTTIHRGASLTISP